MDSTRLAEIDRALASLGVPDARTAEILARHGATGRALADVDAELGQLAEGVALPPSAPLDLEVATASTRDLGSPDEMISEALTADLQRPDAPADDEPELTASPIVEEPTPAPAPASPVASATPSSSGSLQLDELFDDPALTTDFVSPPEESLAAAATAAPAEVEDVGPDVHVSPDLAALLEGEIDPTEFDGKAAAAAPASAAPAASAEEEPPPRVSALSEDLASMLEPDADAVDIDVSEVEILEDDDDGLPPDLSDDQTVVGAPPDDLPATPPSQPPPEEKKGFLRKMFGK